MADATANSQDLVDIEEIRDGIVVLKSGGLRQVVMVGGMNFALKSEEEQNTIALSYQDFLNSLDFPLQILIHSRKVNIERYLEGLESRKAGEISGLLQDQISEYQEFIRSFVKEYAVMKKIFLVIVPFTPLNLPSKETFTNVFSFGKKKVAAGDKAVKTDPQKEAEFKEHANQLAQRVTQVVDGLHTIGLEVTALNDDQMVELFYNFYNPETVEKDELPLPKDQPIEQGGGSSPANQSHA